MFASEDAIVRVAVLGVSGMLGSAAFHILSERLPGQVCGTARSSAILRAFQPEAAENIAVGLDVQDFDALAGFLRETRPTVIVNCIGVVKQLATAEDPLTAIPINSLLPHRLARLADLIGARLIHVSTDCVFTGEKGGYTEGDRPDAKDLYGRSKLLGEVDYENAITLRTSIIGHEIGSQNGLVEWFLAQQGRVKGYRNAIFSGLTTDELVRVIVDYVMPAPELRGVYHVSVDPISKFDLLSIVKNAYGRTTEIEPDDEIAVDRSLDSRRFRSAVGYVPSHWPDLIKRMRAFQETFLSQV
ncbi:dTDP-4-dehydrorhamnose reductase family protein [Methylobacterium sp. PvR107]|uniref:dTDP-4-dehydrorhamnose reductase family protein n=1 Tax=Methylobacterium sp. PvR107 TaxID=2806597 RepID=UPI002474D095|nr:SDR family oxidoreductase [Methylobacterium sp. PvR107]